MTGRELIMYILQNNLEDADVCKKIVLDLEAIGFMSTTDAAAKFGVGPATVDLWCVTGIIKGYRANDGYYIPKNTKDPRCS